MRHSTFWVVGTVGLGVFAAWLAMGGPIESSSGKGRALAAIANALIERFGPNGAALIILLAAIIVAAWIWRTEPPKPWGAEFEMKLKALAGGGDLPARRPPAFLNVGEGTRSPPSERTPIELAGPFEIDNNIITGSTGYDPVSKLRTSVSMSYYGGSGGPTGAGINCYYDEGLRADNIRVIDPRLGTPGYRSAFDGQVRILRIVLFQEVLQGTRRLFVGDFRGSRGVTDANQLFQHPVSNPAEVYRYVLQLAMPLFVNDVRMENRTRRPLLTGLELYLPPRFVSVLGFEDGPWITRRDGKSYLLIGTGDPLHEP
jgi:hypothetical protein